MTEKTMKKLSVILMVIALVGVLILFGYNALLRGKMAKTPLSNTYITEYFGAAEKPNDFELSQMPMLLFIAAILAFVAGAMGSPLWLTAVSVPVWGIGVAALYICNVVIHVGVPTSLVHGFTKLLSVFLEDCTGTLPAIFIIFMGLALAGNFLRKGLSAPFFSMALMGLILYWYYHRELPTVMTTYLLLIVFGIIAMATAYQMLLGKNSPIKAAISWAGTYLMPVVVIFLTNLWVDWVDKEYTISGFAKDMFVRTKDSMGFPPQTVFTYLSLLLLIFGIVLYYKKPAEAPAVAPEEPQATEQTEE